MTTKFLNISTDGTLAGNSDSTVVSEKAIKTYVDGKTASGLVHTTGDETIAGTKTFTGKVVSPIVETGSNANNYFQCQKFRGEGNASTYYHAIDFGYANHDQVDFYEYGGKWVFHKHTGSAQSSGDTVVGQILSTGWNGPVVGNVTGNVTGDLTGNAATATKATQDGDGNVITSTYSTKSETVTAVTGSNDTLTVTKNGNDSTITINNVASATKATQDGNGATISSTYLKLAGGTMTGAINWTGADNKVVGLQLNNSNANLDFGWTWSTGAGAGFALRSTSYATVAERGAFIFFARNGTSSSNTKQLIGKTDGTLTWAGSAVQTASNKAVANGIASLDANTKIPAAQLPVMTGATSSAAGTVGAVPAPVAGANELFLRGDGTWAEPQGGGGGTGPSRNVGEIVPSTVPLTDAGLHLLDGSVISSGSYAAFVSYIAGLVSSHSELFVTESEWQQSITDYGVCGKFVYDSTNNTVRLPKISDEKRYLIASGKSGDAWYRVYSDGWCEQGGKITEIGSNTSYSGSFSKEFVDTNYSLNFSLQSSTGSQTNDEYGFIWVQSTDGFTAYQSNGGTWNSIWVAKGYIDISTYKVIPLYQYIVVANTAKTQIEVDIDEVATDLAAKVDRAELDEVQCIVETYNNGSSWYRVYSDGWCEQGGRTVASSGTGFETVTLLKPYANINYSLSVTNLSGASRGDYRGGSIVDTSTITVGYDNAQSSWETKGYI